ncbi:MAG: TIGR01777 family protein [Verrucomicrobia bacterium 61-8]|nr:TIGR01777 family oxidoreductase [Verrucomicrobiota bacterium]OJV02695.1 MAG: TIGR01777 family protein [Verrucomicrobia bacterium 61-8]
MRIGISGASGFIGAELCEHASQRHDIIKFSRRARGDKRLWSIRSKPDLSGLDAVINLAGESIMGLWTPDKRLRIRDSRVLGTRRLVEAMAGEGNTVKTLVNASAIGFYGDTGENLADESSPAGRGFLADVCQRWEAEAHHAEQYGVRVVCVRVGFVLGKGGAMNLIKPVFSFGLGGNLGSGRQWMSGVHVKDVAGAFLWALEKDDLKGPVNAVLPEPFRNAEFTRQLAHALHRPAFLPAPAFAMRLALGRLSSLLLDSSRVVPRKLKESGYRYRYPSLSSALMGCLE